MTDNEIINKWLNKIEGIKKTRCSVNNPQCMGSAVYGKDGCTCVPLKDTDFEHDPAAWDEGLWDEIEAGGMIKGFIKYLMSSIGYSEDYHTTDTLSSFQMLRTAPAQKARALAQAIEDSK